MHITKILTYITIALIVFAWYIHFTVQSNIQDIQISSIGWTLQDSTKYLEYCEWGFSGQEVEKSDTTCITDYPWVFARNNLILLSILMVLVTIIIAGIQRSRK